LAEILVKKGEGNDLMPVVATFTSPWSLGKLEIRKFGRRKARYQTIFLTLSILIQPLVHYLILNVVIQRLAMARLWQLVGTSEEPV
jgi:hypothetical protein